MFLLSCWCLCLGFPFSRCRWLVCASVIVAFPDHTFLFRGTAHAHLLLIAFTQKPPLNATVGVFSGVRGLHFDRSLYLNQVQQQRICADSHGHLSLDICKTISDGQFLKISFSLSTVANTGLCFYIVVRCDVCTFNLQDSIYF